MKAVLIAAAFSIAFAGAASAMNSGIASPTVSNKLPIVKADVVKKVVVRHPAHRVVKKTVIRH